MNIGVSHLRAVVALADRATFTAAAAELGIGQPALSRAIAETERRLGARLFSRTTRRVELTGDGEVVAAEARRILVGVDDGLREITRFVSGERGIVTIASIPSAAAAILPRYLAPYVKARPGVKIEIHDRFRADVLEEVRTGVADIALVPGPVEGADLVKHRLEPDPFMCVLPPGHPWSGRTAVHWHDLEGQAVVASGLAGEIDHYLRAALEDFGVTLGHTVQAQNAASVAGLVLAGLGIAILPKLTMPLIEFAGLARVRLEPEVLRAVYLVHRTGRPHSSAVSAFIDGVVAADEDRQNRSH